MRKILFTVLCSFKCCIAMQPQDVPIAAKGTIYAMDHKRIEENSDAFEVSDFSVFALENNSYNTQPNHSTALSARSISESNLLTCVQKTQHKLRNPLKKMNNSKSFANLNEKKQSPLYASKKYASVFNFLQNIVPTRNGKLYLDQFDPINVQSILACDGGGSRGYLTLFILNNIVSRYYECLDEFCGCETHNKIPLPFDMYAGTSVGAFVCISTIVHGAKESFNQFPENARKFFIKNSMSCCGLCSAAFSTKGKESAFRDALTDSTKEVADVINGVEFVKKYGVDFITTWYNESSRTSIIYTASDKKYSNVTIVDALMMTSAAPTIYPPYKFELNGEILNAIDGGIFANMPGVVAYYKLREQNPKSNIYLYSIGTGAVTTVVTKHGSGLLGVAPYFLDISMDSNTSLQEWLLYKIDNNDDKFSFWRMQCTIDNDVMSTSDTSDEFFRTLNAIAANSIKEPSKAKMIDDLVSNMVAISIAKMLYNYYLESGYIEIIDVEAKLKKIFNEMLSD